MQRLAFLIVFLLLAAETSMAIEVKITPEIGQFQVRHGDKIIQVIRDQDTQAMIDTDYARTSRPCPPFCVQPMKIAPGVETIGEIELVDFMKTRLSDGSGALIDARTPRWYRSGTIPGSINIPYTHLNPAQGADDITLEDALLPLGVTLDDDDTWDFSKARYLVLWCNGPWCGQSPTAIKGLLSIGYPADKLIYYRGGMQLWRVFGLPLVTPGGELIDLLN
ncbi:MAG: rhodanese-like domain-containing protein [Gammaproteobacteria bacterium]|nr:rhodanese-like domain-containing protein [Gammaproteobacteria bacterium]